jgi:hypothetical protein
VYFVFVREILPLYMGRRFNERGVLEASPELYYFSSINL